MGRAAVRVKMMRMRKENVSLLEGIMRFIYLSRDNQT